ncbi:MAG TPA: DNA internalization-related competence protein ComEC/Rec2 [Candidatus Kapabacteria bacterium]|nr:DNA internalization-related competence protein ComEC/Rec2 [Candidatus Kapabacteria bacterium]
MSPEKRNNIQLRHRPAFVLLIGTSIGIIGANVLKAAEISAIAVSVIGCILFITLSIIFSKLPVIRFFALLLTVCLLGFTAGAAQQYFHNSSIVRKLASLDHPSCLLYGTVISTDDSTQLSDRFIIRTDSLVMDSSVVRTSEKIALTVKRKNDINDIRMPLRSEYIKAYAELEPLDDERNPFASAHGHATTAATGAVAAAFVKSPYDLYILDSAQSLTITDRIAQFFEGINSRIGTLLSDAISDSSARAIVSAVVIGDKRGIDDQTTIAFRRAGLAHILVVSGFNVAIVAALFYYLLRLVGLYRLRWRIIISMIGVACYALVVGLEPSVVRALASVELVFLALLIERKPDIGNITAATATVALLFGPSLLTNPSFQLTYGAVFALVLISPKLSALLIPEALHESKSRSGKLLLEICSTLVSSFSVTIGLLPVLLYHFHRITIIGVFANIIGIPLSGVLTVFGFLLIPMTLISHSLGMLYGDVSALFARLLTWLADYSSSLSWSSLVLPLPDIAFVALYFLGIIFLLLSRSRKQLLVRLIICTSIASNLFILNVPFTHPIIAKNNVLSILFFDVGQGDAALVHTPGNKTYMIDFGGLTHDDNPIAEREIVPLVEAEAMTTIDGGFISHMHIDHYGGVQSLMHDGYIRHLYTSGERSSSESAFALDSIAKTNHIPITKLQRGDTLLLDGNVALFVLNPDTASAVSGSEMNHHSLVLKLCYGRTSALFLGDIEASDELALEDQFGTFLRSDIVKVAHHGSQYSSSSRFTSAVQGKYALVSVGEHNRFGHPTAEALSHWYQSGAEVHRTDREGAVLFRSDGRRVWQEDWR